MNQEELRAFFDRWEVPYMDTGAGLAMESWGNMPRHLQEMMKHRERTGGQNRSQRRGNRERKALKTTGKFRGIGITPHP